MTIEETERAKYERMWADVPDYRNCSPGELEVPAIVEALGLKAGDTVIDFGCGTGRAAKALSDLGMRVAAVDFASNCLDPDVDVAFVQSCLWSLPKNLKADYAIVIDVMEHIPPEKVERTIAEIARCVRRGIYFLIDTSPDEMGKRIGQTLHMTVRQPSWWHEMIGESFAGKNLVVRCR